jgi:hypothetical protein
LVGIVAELQDVRDAAPISQTTYAESDENSSGQLLDQLPDQRPEVDAEVDQRAYLQSLWSEIRQLPPRQCAALLLNLRDPQGRGVIALLPLTGVATMRQIAEALAMPADEFAELWNDLPIEDNGIAALLGITRQQVINLRKVARERLMRRMRTLEAET